MLFVLLTPFKIDDAYLNKMALSHVAGNWGIMMLSPLRSLYDDADHAQNQAPPNLRMRECVESLPIRNIIVGMTKS